MVYEDVIGDQLIFCKGTLFFIYNGIYDWLQPPSKKLQNDLIYHVAQTNLS